MPQNIRLDWVKHLSTNPASVSARFHRARHRKVTDDYQVTQKVLGAGLCGNVMLVRRKADGREYALKIIKKNADFAPEKLSQVLAEVEIHMLTDHPNIARLHDVYESNDEISLVMEYCSGGELYFQLQQRGVFKAIEAAEATRQMFRAVGYLHAHSVAHRDLKLENFLYERAYEECSEHEAQLKLIDFGFAELWDPASLMTAACGSVAYVSPEVLRGKGYTNKCDIWSLGVIVWMLLAGYPPFHGEEKVMMGKIRRCQADWNHKARWAKVPDDAIAFVGALLVKDPAYRPDAATALRHPWLLKEAVAQEAHINAAVLLSLESYASSSRLRRVALQLLAQELAPEEKCKLRSLFFAIDRANAGTICFRDLRDAIQNAGPEDFEGGAESDPLVSLVADLRCSSSNSLLEIFKRLSATGDGPIYYSDFLAATMEAQDHLREEAVRATFDRLDADRSGTIGVTDLKLSIGDTFEGFSVDLLFQEVPDARGSIDFDAFVTLVTDPEQAAAALSPRGGTARRISVGTGASVGSDNPALRFVGGLRARVWTPVQEVPETPTDSPRRYPAR